MDFDFGKFNFEGEELFKAQNMYESLRFAEYDFTSGIGEILDNAIEAKANTINVDIETEEIITNKGRNKKVSVVQEVVIVDNGLGMDVEILKKALVLGESCRPIIQGKKGIGRFGVGLTLGGISLARRIEVYTRNSSISDFIYTYIDLDEIKAGNMIRIPLPEKKNPDKKYMDYLESESGTIIRLVNCDRLRIDEIKGDTINSSEQIKGLSTFIGRTYRKFIGSGLNIFLNNEKVYLHDPLYLDGPTIFDSKREIDLKAEFKGEEIIELEIPNSGGKKADVKITMSLLPKEWRKTQGDGGSDFAKKRKIDMNEGVSILRADREVLYDKVEYIIGSRGTSRYLNIDRFWGCEISFPPELDSYFHVRYIKRGAEPIPSLRDKIREKIAPVVNSLRKEIQRDWDKNKADEISENGVFDNVESTMANIVNKLPRSIKGKNISDSEAEERVEETVKSIIPPKDTDEEKFKEEKKKELLEKPYKIELVSYPANIMFENEFILGNIIIKLNVNHPFYTKVILPLCNIKEDYKDEENNAFLMVNDKFKDAIMLLLLSYSKAESMFNGNDELFQNFNLQWGTILSAATKELFR